MGDLLCPFGLVLFKIITLWLFTVTSRRCRRRRDSPGPWLPAPCWVWSQNILMNSITGKDTRCTRTYPPLPINHFTFFPLGLSRGAHDKLQPQHNSVKRARLSARRASRPVCIKMVIHERSIFNFPPFAWAYWVKHGNMAKTHAYEHLFCLFFPFRPPPLTRFTHRLPDEPLEQLFFDRSRRRSNLDVRCDACTDVLILSTRSGLMGGVANGNKRGQASARTHQSPGAVRFVRCCEQKNH